jgi:hypothetical protein
VALAIPRITRDFAVYQDLSSKGLHIDLMVNPHRHQVMQIYAGTSCSFYNKRTHQEHVFIRSSLYSHIRKVLAPPARPNSRGNPFCFAILIFETVVRESCNVSIAVIPVNKLSMRECHGCWWAKIHERLNIVGCQYFSNAAVQYPI